jgi:hypothetical protein
MRISWQGECLDDSSKCLRKYLAAVSLMPKRVVFEGCCVSSKIQSTFLQVNLKFLKFLCEECLFVAKNLNKKTVVVHRLECCTNNASMHRCSDPPGDGRVDRESQKKKKKKDS